jgi:hypothetical protein
MDQITINSRLNNLFEQRPLLVRDGSTDVALRNYQSRAQPGLVGRSKLPAAEESILPLRDLLQSLERYPEDFSFGEDIDAVQRALLDPAVGIDQKHSNLRSWLSRHQPCLFGRLGARGLKGIDFDICWIDERDLVDGEVKICRKIQNARRAWKDRAAEGMSHGFLIMFNLASLAFARPGERLLEVCGRLANSYLVESAPILNDTIYTEAIPLRTSDGWLLFKGGINIFYTGAHRTLNHDRRVPGGLLISVNSPGHLANSLFMRGLAPTFESAVDMMFDLAMRSIGNGGAGDDRAPSTSWHSGLEPGRRCPVVGHRQQSTPKYYSASYHTDVLVPELVTKNATLDPIVAECEIWPWLIIDYINNETYAPSHLNYALFRGHPVDEEARYFNPWPPRRASNTLLAE